jgi:hypothetical protein
MKPSKLKEHLQTLYPLNAKVTEAVIKIELLWLFYHWTGYNEVDINCTFDINPVYITKEVISVWFLF